MLKTSILPGLSLVFESNSLTVICSVETPKWALRWSTFPAARRRNPSEVNCFSLDELTLNVFSVTSGHAFGLVRRSRSTQCGLPSFIKKAALFKHESNFPKFWSSVSFINTSDPLEGLCFPQDWGSSSGYPRRAPLSLPPSRLPLGLDGVSLW